MKYLSFDLETTGLVRSPENILQIAAVVEDTKDIKPVDELPRFVCFIDRESYTGSAYALQMNSWIFKEIIAESPKYPVIPLEMALRHLTIFIKHHFDNDKCHLAGANVGTFDLQFLPEHMKRLFHYRCIEIGSVFMDWEKGPLGVSHECTHDALEDALLVIRKLRSAYAPVNTD